MRNSEHLFSLIVPTQPPRLEQVRQHAVVAIQPLRTVLYKQIRYWKIWHRNIKKEAGKQ